MKFAQLVMRHRLLALFLILGSTTFLFTRMLKVTVRTSFDELLPRKHPYIQLHKMVRDKFAGANVVTMSLDVKKGDIFNPATLEKIKYLTEQLDLVPGINHYQVESIAHIKVRNIRTTLEGMVRSMPLLPEDIPTTKAEMDQVKRDCYSNETVYGRLVSYDGKSALITGAFFEHMLNYPVIFQRLRQMRRDVQDENHVLHISGQPMLYGWIYYHYIYNAGILWGLSSVTTLGLTMIILFGLLIFYFRRICGVIVPMTGAIISAIWGIGFAGLAGYDFDPLILIVHLLVTARCISHSVQVTERYLEEYEATGDKRHSAMQALADLFVPGSISVVTDALGIYVVSFASIPIMHRLAFFNTAWGMSIIASVLILTPIMLSYLPAPRKRERYVVKPVERYLHVMARLATGPTSRWVIVGISVVTLVAAYIYSTNIIVGDTRPGSPLLWPDHDYNVSSRRINQRFAGSNHLYIIFDSKENDAIKDPVVLSTMDRFGEYMRQNPVAGGDFSIATMARSINKMYHYEDPVWGMIPATASDAGGFFFQYEIGAPIPRILSTYMDPQAKQANLAIYYKDAAITKAITTTGMAVTFTATCLVGGIVFWYPLSPIRFQCEMAILLALLMGLNAFMAVTLVPSLFSIIKPKFALAMQAIPKGKRMAGAAAYALLFLGLVSAYGLWTGHRNIDAEFFKIVMGLIVVLIVFGVGVQNVET